MKIQTLGIMLVFILNLPCMIVSGQLYNGTKIISYQQHMAGEGVTADTVAMVKVNAAMLDTVISSYNEVFVHFYKPYCPALIKEGGLSPMDSVIHFCKDNQIPVLFIATSALATPWVHRHFINRYQLQHVSNYLIDETIRRKEYARIFKKYGINKLKKTSIYLRDNKVVFQGMSYDFDTERFKEVVRSQREKQDERAHL